MAAAGLLVGAVAAFCRAPDVLFADAGELLTAIATRGVAHPPGFPLYLLVGGLWLDATRFLASGPASRLNLLSALCDGVAAAAIALAALALFDRLGLRLTSLSRAMLSFAAGLLAGFGPTLFDFSLGIEVYALHAVFLALVLAFALSPPTPRNAVLCGFAAGAGLAVHHATMVVILPGLALLLWGEEDRKARLRRVGLFCAALLPGLATYALLPLRAARKPALNWGDPSNASRFFEHISAAIYQVNIESKASVIADHAERFLAAYRDEATLGGILLALVAALVVFRKGTYAGAGLLLVVAGDIAFAVRYEIAEDQAAYYIPTFLVTALLLVTAVAWGASRLRKGETAVVLVAFLAFSALVMRNTSLRAGRRHDGRAAEAASNLLSSLPAGALALTPEWNLYAPARAALDVDGRRSDVLLLDILLLRRGWYLDSFARRHPERLAEARAEFDAYRSKLADWEEGRPYDGDLLTRVYGAFTQKLVVEAFRRNAPVVWIGTVMTDHLPKGAALVPAGVGYRVLPSGVEAGRYLADAPMSLALAKRADLPLDDAFEKKVRPLYAGMLTQRALYELAFQKRERAVPLLAEARAVVPTNAEATEVMGDLAAEAGEKAKALELYTEALRNGGDAARLAEKSRRLSP